MSRMKLGVMASLEEGPEEALRRVHELGFPTCQVSCWRPALLTDKNAGRLRAAAAANAVEITTLWTGMPGRYVWDLVEGPNTIGLVPAETRRERLDVLLRASVFAERAGISSLTTHVGFIPDNPADLLYTGLLSALGEAADCCAAHGQSFWFETGQETPVTLLRTIEDLARPNLGINLDPANLLLYGKANPVDALDVFGRYVRGVHAKDGEYPTDGRHLGKEKPLGAGRVNFPALLARLHALGYQGALTIEREISGPQQIEDIRKGRELLERVLETLV